MFYHIPDDDNVELVVQFGYFVDILADQCQVSVVGMYAVDFFCDCNRPPLMSMPVTWQPRSEKGLYVSSFPATDFENVESAVIGLCFSMKRYYIFFCVVILCSLKYSCLSACLFAYLQNKKEGVPKAFILLSTPSDILISVMFGLIRSFDRYADVIGLLLCQLGQFDADALQVEAGNFFVQTFRQAVDTYLVRHCP